MGEADDKREKYPVSTTEVVLVIAIIILAFSLRIAFLCQMAESPIADLLAEDSKIYNDWAREIAGGDWSGKEVFYALPLYPYFLGLIYSVLGYHLYLAKFIQVVIGTTNCYLVYLLGRRLFPPSVALLAAFFMAAYGMLIVYDSAILPPVLSICLCACLLLYLLRIQSAEKGSTRWLFAGFLSGVTGTACAQVFLFIPLVVVWIFCTFPSRAFRRKTAAAGCYLLGAVTVIALTTWRNWRVEKDFVPLTAHAGINFFIGNNPRSEGVFEPPPGIRSGADSLRRDSALAARKALGRQLRPSEVSAYWYNRGVRFINEQPGSYLRLLVWKFTLFWDSLEIADVIHPGFFKGYAPLLKAPLVTFGMAAPVSLLGLCLGLRMGKKLLLLYLFVAGYTISTVLFFINARYRLPIVPFLMLFAAYAVFWLWKKLRERQPRPVALSLVLLLFFVLWVNPRLYTEPRFILDTGAAHNHLGAYHYRKGDYRRAREEFEKALRLEPDRPEAYFNLAKADLKLGRTEEAMHGYREAIRLKPDYIKAHCSLADALAGTGNPGRAIEVIERALHADPDSAAAYVSMGFIYGSLGRYSEALEAFRAAARIEPDLPVAHLGMGMVYVSTGDRISALDEYRILEEMDSDQAGKLLEGINAGEGAGPAHRFHPMM